MFVITEEMVKKHKTFESLLVNQVRFCDMVNYKKNPEEFFRTAITESAALELFEHNTEEIRQNTPSLKKLWQDTSKPATRVSLTRAAFYYALEPYIRLYGKEGINSAGTKIRGLANDSKETVLEYQKREAAQNAAAHKRYGEERATQWI